MKKQIVGKNETLERRISEAFLLTSLLFDITVLIIMPNHLSLVAMILLLTNLLALFMSNSHNIGSKFHKAAVLSVIYSLMYLLLVLYWHNAGASACSEFFGSYRSCLESAQQVFIEVVALPIILLTATRHFLKKRT